jgi:5-methylcytosine-specific restriction enzyme subunit McrC
LPSMSNQKQLIRVFEHEAIFTLERQDGRYITQNQFEQLCAFNDLHGNKYFTVVKRGIKFNQFVGVVQVGRLTIEILPKTDNDDSQLWHNVLLQMLAECRKVKKESVSEAQLKKRANSLLDLYIEMYLDEVDQLVHKGLVKKYLRERGQTKALKGKLLFTEQLRKNLVHKERFYTEHSLYTADNIYNQIVKRGLEVVSKLNCAPNLKDRAAGLSLYLHHVADNRKISAKTFERLPSTRNTEKYKEVLAIARLIILNYSPDISSGTEDLLAILFDMNALWEEYIYRQLVKTKSDGFEVHSQRRQKFWEQKEIKPDIVIKRGEEVFVIDTKWKVLDQATPSDSDLKQIFAYNLYWDSYHSILLYPRTDSSPDNTFGSYHKGMGKKHGCTLAFVNLLDQNNQLDTECGKKIWNILQSEQKEKSVE